MGDDGPPTHGEGRLVLRRAFTILGAFTPQREELSLAELTKSVNLPKSTVHRLAQQLVDEGALDRTEFGYRLGLRMFELGTRAGPERQIREVAVPFMRDLYETMRETVQLAVLDGLEVVYLEKIEGPRSVRLPTQVGCRMPAYCTALGKVLLAYADRERIDQIFSQAPIRRTPYTITQTSVLVDQLAAVAQQGVAYDREESVVGAACVAVPLLDRSGAPIAALSVSGPMTRFDPQAVSHRLRRTAHAVTQAFRTVQPAL